MFLSKLDETLVEGEEGLARRREADVQGIGEIHARCMSANGNRHGRVLLKFESANLESRGKKLIDCLTRDFHDPAHHPFTFKQNGRRYHKGSG